MPNSEKQQKFKLTDNLLVQLYNDFENDYAYLSKLISDHEEIKASMRANWYERMQYNTYPLFPANYQRDALATLDYPEKQKISEFLEIYLNSRSGFHTSSNSYRQQAQHIPIPNPGNNGSAAPNIIVIKRSYRPYGSRDFLFDWMLLDAVSHNHHHCGYSSSYSTGAYSSSSVNTANWNDDSAQVLAVLLVILLASLVFILSMLAIFYILKMTVRSMERFIWNEGWLQAAINMGSLLASGAVGGWLAFAFLGEPLFMLALTAGLASPVGFTVSMIIGISIISTALTSYLANVIQEYAIPKIYTDAIDPNEPCRYGLSQGEENYLKNLGYNTLAVKNALIALRCEANHEIVKRRNASVFSSYTLYFFGRTDDEQKVLDQIRQLKRGEAGDTIRVGGKAFDLKQFPPPPWQNNIFPPGNINFNSPPQPQPSFYTPQYQPPFNPAFHSNFEYGQP